jgi:peptidoglycan hydrolase-like protein with peptidoglycan-binding domain
MASKTFAGVTYANGKIPANLLAKLDGKHGSRENTNAYLRRDAADSFNRVRAEIKQRYGDDFTVRGWWRDYATQVRMLLERSTTSYIPGALRRWYGGRWRYLRGAAVATPGYSNHGWGLAIDVNDFGGVGNFSHPRRVKYIAILKKHGWTETEGRRISEPWHLVYEPSSDRGKSATTPKRRKPHRISTIRRGTSDWRTNLWQRFLVEVGELPKGSVDNDFGRKTEAATKRWQEKANLKPDGIVGTRTWFRAAYGVEPGRRGARVEIAQRIMGLLGKAADGVFGSGTVTRAKEVQRWLGVKPDADWGHDTITQLLRKG